MLPIITTGFIFSLDYAGLERWVNRRTVIILAAPSIIIGLLILTNGTHHLIWNRLIFDGTIHIDRGPITWGCVVYASLLSLLQLMVLVRLFLNSPRHRWVAAGLIVSPFIIRGAYVFTLAGWNPPVAIDPMTVAATLAVIPYAVAVFHNNMFYMVPIARDTVIETMPNGIMVLDIRDRVVDINAKVRKIFRIIDSKASGDTLDSVLKNHSDLWSFLQDPDQAECELCFGEETDIWYHVSQSPLIDRRGYNLGRLIWFHDVTEQKRARERVIDKQRALAMLKERELLARELHDGIGQMVAAADLQITSAKIFVDRGDTSGLGDCLQNLAEVTQETKEIIREYLVGVKSPTEAEGIVTIVRNDIRHFTQNYAIKTELLVPSDLETMSFDSAVSTQLQPIIQEALMNIRRHSKATSARVVFEPIDGELRVIVEDDGQGFDSREPLAGQGFGLRSMRGRAEMIGARFDIISAPGKGTRVILEIPWKKEEK
jgi:signal transduction histidine kinase